MDCPRCYQDRKEKVRLSCYYSKNYGFTIIRRRVCPKCQIKIETTETLITGKELMPKKSPLKFQNWESFLQLCYKKSKELRSLYPVLKEKEKF